MHNLNYLFYGWFLLVLCSFVSSGQASTRTEFERFCNQMEGLWLGTVPARAGIPDLDDPSDNFIQVGQPVPGYFHVKKIARGNALRMFFVGDQRVQEGMFLFHPAEHEIQLRWVDSDGVVSAEVVTASGNVWKFEGERSFADGTTKQIAASIELTEAGNGFVLSSNIDSQEPSTFKRISGFKGRPGGAEQLQDFGDAMVGTWVEDVTWINDWAEAEEGRGNTSIDYEIWRWVADGRILELAQYAGTGMSRSYFVWDPVAKQIIGLSGSSTDNAAVFTVHRGDGGKWSWIIQGGGTSDGKPFAGAIVSETGAEGTHCRYSGRISLGGELLDPLKDVMYRVLP